MAKFIGLLSGTSCDAVDCVIVEFEHDSIHLLATHSYPWPEDLRLQYLAAIRSGEISLQSLGQLDHRLGILFGQAVLATLAQAGVPPDAITAIGSHGQTLWHAPKGPYPFTLQIGDPNLIAELTQIPVVADVRRRDMAVGGQGAPLAPGFHHQVFGGGSRARVIVNIGGITNISILHEGTILGFDTGPGNCLMDEWISHNLGQAYDMNGAWARTGAVPLELLTLCLADPYFSSPPPKSTGREYFNLEWFKTKMTHLFQYKAEDLQACLMALTVMSLSQAIEHYAPSDAEIYLCGGGAHNEQLVETLEKSLARPCPTTEALGIAPDWVEGALFAWVAKQTCHGLSSNSPVVTGARKAAILGGVYGTLK